MKTTKKTFKGGFVFKRFPGHPETSVEAVGLPETVMYPLRDAESLNEALVAKGDKVKAGQLLWRNDDLPGSPVIATVNGLVEKIKPIKWNGSKIPVITVKPDGTEDWIPLSDSTDIEEILYLSGTASLGNEGIPTGFNTSPLKPEDVEHLIISHCEDDVYNTDLSVLIGDRIDDFYEGLLLLKKVLPGALLHMAINRKNSEWIGKLSTGPFDEMVLVKPKYPQGMDQFLVETVIGKKIPGKCSAANAGAVVLGVQDVLHVFDAVKKGKPLLDRVVALAGPGFSNRSYVKVRIGTPYDQIVKGRIGSGEIRCILNSAMNGRAVEYMNKPIGPECDILVALEENRAGEVFSFAKPGFRKHSMMYTMANAFLPFTKNNDTNLNGEERACLSCGNCYNLCPAGLYPTQLYKYVERDKVDEVPMRYGIFRCFDCNLCTYGCTAKIPLADWIGKGKEMLIEEGYTTGKEIVAAYGLKETE